MTTLNVSLSTALQTTLGQTGINAYAVYFNSAGTGVWTTMVDDGTILLGGQYAIDLPDQAGLKVYFLIQSAGANTQPINSSTIPTQSAINWGTAASMDYRYDSFEVTLSGKATDAGNLTSVNGFGLPMSVVVPYANGSSASVGYGVTGGQIATDIADIGLSANPYTYTYTAGPLAGQFRAALSPAETANSDPVVADPPFNASDWDGYVASLEGSAASQVLLSGMFNGAEDAAAAWHNPGYFAYTLEWDAAGGVFWLSPTEQSTIKGYIQITPSELTQNIYSTVTNVNVFTAKTDAQPYLTMNAGYNNQWGKVLSEFLTGFTGGFYGQTGISPNPQVTAAINLGNNANWDPDYAFGRNVTPGTDPGYQTSDPYSEIFYFNSNSYGSGYSDALMSQYSVGGPLIIVGQTDPTTGTQSDVDAINLTIFDDTETPTGYTQPVIYNYVAAPAGGYTLPDSNGTANNITLNFGAAVANTAGVTYDPAGQIVLRVMTGLSAGVPQWQYLTMDGSSAAAGSLGLWQQWTVSGGPGAYTIAPQVPAVVMNPGTLLINNFPSAQGGGVSWYQIVVGDKTFNLYTTTAANGAFVNGGIASGAGQLAVDGLATLGLPAVTDATIATFGVNFAGGSTVAYDPGQLQPNYLNVAFAPWSVAAPVAGQLSGQTFTSVSGQTGLLTNSVSTSLSSIAFGWTGLNAENTSTQWTTGYTNQIDPLTVAHVTINPVIGGPAITADATSDLDGKWMTSPVLLQNGTYTVTMQEFLPSDTAYANPLTPVSGTLTLEVDAPCFMTGTRIATAEGERAVETLRVGEHVRLALEDATREIVWIGHRTVDCRRHPDPRQVWPVRVAAGALGLDARGRATPARALYLSPDHAVYLDGVLIPIRYLVNGTTIAQVRRDSVTYYHIELATHDVLLAEGAAAESYLDTGDRSNFANAPGTTQLHPDFSLAVWEAEGRAPLVIAGPLLAAARAGLAA